MLDDDERKQRARAKRRLVVRILMGLDRRDVVSRFRRRAQNDSDVLFRMAHAILNTTNDTPAVPRVLRRAKRSFEYTQQQMYTDIRFSHSDFQTLMGSLNLPDRFRFDSWSFAGEEALLLLLRRMASVTTFEKLRSEFRRDECELCACFNGMVAWLVDTHGHLISGIYIYILLLL